MDPFPAGCRRNFTSSRAQCSAAWVEGRTAGLQIGASGVKTRSDAEGKRLLGSVSTIATTPARDQYDDLHVTTTRASRFRTIWK